MPSTITVSWLRPYLDFRNPLASNRGECFGLIVRPLLELQMNASTRCRGSQSRLGHSDRISLSEQRRLYSRTHESIDIAKLAQLLRRGDAGERAPDTTLVSDGERLAQVMPLHSQPTNIVRCRRSIYGGGCRSQRPLSALPVRVPESCQVEPSPPPPKSLQFSNNIATPAQFPLLPARERPDHRNIVGWRRIPVKNVALELVVSSGGIQCRIRPKSSCPSGERPA